MNIRTSKDPSKRGIKPKIQCELWGRAAGRCEFCNCLLFEDSLTISQINKSNIAHIIAFSPDGPRGDIELSNKLKDDINNLMLLCPEHHKLIDEHYKDYPASTLKSMKENFELHKRLQTEANFEQKRLVIIYTSPIGNIEPKISFKDAIYAMSPIYYPMVDNPIDLQSHNFAFRDNENVYWTIQSQNLEKLFQQKLINAYDNYKDIKCTVFALAPQPLLVKLGTLLSDVHDVKIFQPHRTGIKWKWKNNIADNEFNYIVHEPYSDSTNKIAILVFSLSSSILERVKVKYKNKNVAYWEVTIENPNNDFLQSENQLEKFHHLVPTLLDEIKRKTNAKELHVFMSMPTALCVMLGMSWMPKAHLPMILYDYIQKNGMDFKTITIKH